MPTSLVSRELIGSTAISPSSRHTTKQRPVPGRALNSHAGCHDKRAQGFARYILEGTEKLNYLTGRLGDEIAQLRGKRAGFAPHWAAPDRVAHALKRDVPLWVIGAVLALCGLLAFLGLRWSLERKTQSDLMAYSQVVRLAPQSANITITLP